MKLIFSHASCVNGNIWASKLLADRHWVRQLCVVKLHVSHVTVKVADWSKNTILVSGKGGHWTQHSALFNHTVLVIGFPWESKLVYHISTKHFISVQGTCLKYPKPVYVSAVSGPDAGWYDSFSAGGFNSSYGLTGMLPFIVDSVVKYQMSPHLQSENTT